MKPYFTRIFLAFVILLSSIAGVDAQLPTLEWAYVTGSATQDIANGIHVDAAGNVYTTGDFESTVDFGFGVGTNNLTSNGSGDIYITKQNASGNLEWAKNIGGGFADTGYSLLTDASGNVYVAGGFQAMIDLDPGPGTANRTSNGFYDIFLIKLDAAGDYQWGHAMGSSAWDLPFSMQIDGNGNIYMTGYFKGTVDFDPGAGSSTLTPLAHADVFIVKYSSAGNFIWVKGLQGIDAESGYSIDIDAADNVLVTGRFNGTTDFDPGTGTTNLTSNGGYDFFAVKLTSAGNFLWARSVGGTGHDFAFTVKTNATNDVLIGGSFEGTVDFDPGANIDNFVSNGDEDLFLLKLDAAGNYQWAKTIGGSGDEVCTALSIDNQGRLYMTGDFQGIVDFNPGGGTFNLTALSSNYDMFMLKLNSNGNFAGAINVGGGIFCTGAAIATDIWGNIHITGNINGTADFDPGPGTNILSSVGFFDLFIAKYSQGPVGIYTNEGQDFVSVYPNPAINDFTIQFAREYSKLNVSITNTIGQVISSQTHLNTDKVKLSIEETGLFFIELRTSSGEKVMVKQFIESN